MIKNKDEYLTSAEVAEALGFSHDYVRKLILKGTIKAEKLGRNWIINKKNINRIRRQRFPSTQESVNGSNE